MKFPYSALAAGALISVLALSCKTIDSNIPPGTPTEIYFQRAQQASDLYDYNTALKIYGHLLDRTDIDLSTRVQAQYEVAFLNYKMGHKAVAKAEFKEILDLYNDPKQVNLPIWVRILSEKVSSKIPDQPQPPQQSQQVDKSQP